MTTASTIAPARHEPQLLGQTVVVIGANTTAFDATDFERGRCPL
jgi:hypothetical protein